MTTDIREQDMTLTELVQRRNALEAHRDFIGKLTPEEQEELKGIERKLEDFDLEDVAKAIDEAYLKQATAEASTTRTTTAIRMDVRRRT